MPVIPLLIEPWPGELACSYFSRLAKTIGWPSFDSFSRSILAASSSNIRHTAKLDGFSLIGSFYQLTLPPVPVSQFILDQTTYGGMAPFLPSNVQMAIVNEIGRPGFFSESLCQPAKSLVDDLYVCPDCQKEDEASCGQWYLHREHHMPFIHVCHKHGVPLKKLKYSGRDILSGQPAETIDCDDLRWEIRYSRFISAMLEKPVDSDLAITKSVLKSEIHARNLSSKQIQEMMDQCGCSVWTGVSAEKLINGLWQISSECRLDLLIPLTVLLFDRYEEFEQKINSSSMRRKKLYRFLTEADKAYVIFEPLRLSLVEMALKDDEENSFYTTDFGFHIGWREPWTDIGKNPAMKFKEMFDLVSNGRYELLSEYKSNNQPVQIKCLKCDSVQNITPRKFLYENRRCYCQQQITPGEAREMVEEIPGGFHLLDYNGTERDCTILHDQCGSTFTCKFQKFIRFSGCRVCAKHSYSREAYLQEVKSLVGDEYEVLEYPKEGHNEIM